MTHMPHTLPEPQFVPQAVNSAELAAPLAPELDFGSVEEDDEEDDDLEDAVERGEAEDEAGAPPRSRSADNDILSEIQMKQQEIALKKDGLLSMTTEQRIEEDPPEVR